MADERSDTTLDLAANVKRERKRRGWGQRGLAERARVSRWAVRSLEAGRPRRARDAEADRRVCSLLGLPTPMANRQGPSASRQAQQPTVVTHQAAGRVVLHLTTETGYKIEIAITPP